MGFTSEEVVVAQTGHIYSAPVETDFPADISEAVDLGDWFEHGLTTEDGVKFTSSRQTNNIPAWQKMRPVRTINTSVEESVEFTLLQTNQGNLELACGGGAVTGSDPDFVYTPPDPGFVDHRAFIIEAQDGDKNYRICIRKGLNTNGVEFSFVRKVATTLAIKLSILEPETDGDEAWFIQTDDVNIGELAEAGS